MSRESYARGFCKAAEAAGVDPMALAKYAADISANVGTFAANGGATGTPMSTSYVGRLDQHAPASQRRKANAVLPNLMMSRGGNENSVVMDSDIIRNRKAQAQLNADRLYPRGTNANRAIVSNLEDAGRKNFTRYQLTGDTIERSAPNMQNVEGYKFTPEQLEQLRVMQNSMVSNGGRGATANMA